MELKVNVGVLDRRVRLAVGIVLLAVAALGGAILELGAGWRVLAGSVGVVMIVVGLTRVCPLYTLVGFKTCGER